jgi:hypothetical protein
LGEYHIGGTIGIKKPADNIHANIGAGVLDHNAKTDPEHNDKRE